MKCIYLLLFLEFILPISLKAQSISSFDSLQTAFSRATSDTAKLRILFADRPMKYMGNSDGLLQLYQKGYMLAKQNNDKVARFKAIHYTALTYMYGKLDEEVAYKWLQKALVEATATKNNLFIGTVYYAMGIIHDHQGNRDEMYKAFYRSADYIEKAPDPVVGPFNALSVTLENDKKWEEQLSINKRMVALMERTKAPLTQLVIAYDALVNALRHFPNRKQEFAYYRNKTLTTIDSVPMSAITPDVLLIISAICHKYNRSDLAINYAQQILNWGDKNGDLTSKCLANSFLSEVYEEQKNYQLALKYSRQFHILDTQHIESRLKDDAGKKIIQAQAKHDIALKQNEVERQQLYTYWSIAVAVLVIMLSIAIYYIYRREQARKAEFQQLNATKDKLFAILSHDLRSPVGALENNVMLTNWGALTQDEFVETTQNLGQEIRQVRTMLDNVLHWSISQLGGMKPHPKTTFVLPIIEAEIKLLHASAQAKGIKMTSLVAPEAQLMVDSNHLAIIIRNLLQNAIKFTPTQGEISIKSAEKGKQFQLEIKDTGIGISQEQLRKLFTINESSSHQGTSQEKGTGLGLVLVKELVVANKGTIEIKSEIGKGCTCSITFQQS